MILTCPACGTSYVVKDGAIPPQGRQVRCASCKHSWHQDPETPQTEPAPTAVKSTLTPAQDVVPQAVEEATVAEETPSVEQFSAPTEEASDNAQLEDRVSQPSADVAEKPQDVVAPVATTEPVEDELSDWNDAAYHDEVVPPRRKGLVIVILIVLFIAALAAAAWFFAPREWMARAGLREAAGDSPLKLMVTSQDRQKLASGNDLVSLSGRVINPTEQTLTVPPLQADLRDGSGKLVYSWTIAPPAPRLPPRGSASFNAAELGVPANATSLTLRWAS